MYRNPLVAINGRADQGRRRGALHAMAMAVAVALCVPGHRVQAAATLKQSEQAFANFAFASQLGSGIYDVSGRTIQIYRLPLAWELARPEKRRWGVTLTLPLTLGFYDFRLEDVLDSQLPTSVDTFSAVPGVELSRRVGRRWRLTPFAEAGFAHEASTSTNGMIYAAGVRATYEFEPRHLRARYQVELLDAVADFSDRPQDSMLRLTNGVEARRNLGLSALGEDLDWAPYVLAEWYLVRPAPPLSTLDHSVAPFQTEVGVTFGTVRPAHIWKIPVPRVGLGYRFGKNLSVPRITFGAPF
jgi:hypothetical protein